MASSKNKLINELEKYYSDTLSEVKIVKNFISKWPEWEKKREAELQKMTDIKERDQKLNKKRIQIHKKRNKKQLQQELEDSLKETLDGLKEMQMFLEAVETLAVTSPHVFEQNQVLQLPNGADLKSVQEIILVAQVLCPLLLLCRRDNEAFFQPKLENIEIMQNQLNSYKWIVKQICDGLPKWKLDHFRLDVTMSLKEDVSDDKIEKMLSQIEKLNKCRMDEDFRLRFLFQDEYKTFMEEFKERRDRMLELLTDLEACAVQMDKMNKGAKISNVAGSSVGLVSGILSIVGFALIPVTVGASLGLVGAGAGLAVASGANSLVTTGTELGVNHNQKKKADETFKKFMEDVEFIQNSVNEVIKKIFVKIQKSPTMKKMMLLKTGVSVAKSIDTIVDCISAYRVVNAAGAGLPELGQVKESLNLTKGARGLFLPLNVAFIGFDLFSIVKNSKDLHKGSETEMSKILRATAALWKSEIDSWKKMHKCLEKGLKNSEKIDVILEEPFY